MIIAVVAMLIASLALVLAVSAHRRLTAARRSLSMLQGSFEGKTLLDAVAAYLSAVRDLEAELMQVSVRQEQLYGVLGRSTRNMGIVKFDAFEEMGGKVSFSVALVDDHGDGAVITSINGRTESRVYTKVIQGGSSDQTLSPEEEEAISQALGRLELRR